MPKQFLTNAFLKALQPPQSGTVEYWDQRTVGLCLRLYASGRGSWTFRYRTPTGNERITLGPMDVLSLSQARDRAQRHRVEVADGENPQRKKQEARAAAGFSFDDLAARYLEEYARPRKSSWRMDELYLKRPRQAWAKRAASQITRKDVIVVLDGIRDTAPVSSNRTLTILKTMFSWAVESELLDASPATGIKPRAKEQPKERVLTDPEIRLLWSSLSVADVLRPDVAGALKLLLLTGQRPGEIAGIEQHEVMDLGDPEKARIEVPGRRMKARKPHVIPLAPMARSVVLAAWKRRREEGDGISLFASRFSSRDVIARHTLSQSLRRLIASLPDDGGASLKADPPTPHDFRRTVLTRLAALGIPREDRLAIAAHAASDVHGVHYDKYERWKEKRAALELWETTLSVLGGGQP